MRRDNRKEEQKRSFKGVELQEEQKRSCRRLQLYVWPQEVSIAAPFTPRAAFRDLPPPQASVW